MKGTIDATIENADEIIMADEKEYAEHITIVDLIRNDLSRSVGNSKVERFRYIDEISTNSKSLLQVSSEISAELEEGDLDRLGNIILEMLPAGSVCGAPKRRTLEIIKGAEIGERGYYCGVSGIFDGKNLDSTVNIRFIEKNKGHLYYRSGGGITVYSDSEKEYMEMVDKVYVPIDRISAD